MRGVRFLQWGVMLDLAQGAYFGKPHAIGRQDPGIGVDEHTTHTQGVGNQAGMLPTRAAEALQGIAGHIMAALDADFLDRIGHVVHGDAQEAGSHVFRAARRGAGFAGDLCGECFEPGADGNEVELFIAIRAKDRREMIWVQLAQHDIAVCHGKRPATPIAGWAGICARTFGADLEAAFSEPADGSAAGGNGVNIHHRSAHADACDLGFEGPFIGARVMADIGGSAAHVKADELVMAHSTRSLYHADNAARRTGQDGILALKQRGIGQSARALHEQQPVTGASHVERICNLLYVAAQDWGKVGIDHGGVAATYELGQFGDFVAGTDLGKADLASDLGRALFMGGVQIGVQPGDGHSVQAAGIGVGQCLAQGGFVQRLQDIAIGVEPLVHFGDLLVEQFGPLNVEVKELGAGLVADKQKVAETFGDQQQNVFALAFEQSVGGNGGAHLDRTDTVVGDRAAGAQQVPDALHGCVPVAFGVFAKQFVGLQGAIGVACDDVGEGAAPVDPEFPLAAHVLPFWLCCASDRHRGKGCQLGSGGTALGLRP